MENKTIWGIWGIWECQDIFWRKKIFQEKTTFSEGNLKLQLHFFHVGNFTRNKIFRRKMTSGKIKRRQCLLL